MDKAAKGATQCNRVRYAKCQLPRMKRHSHKWCDLHWHSNMVGTNCKLDKVPLSGIYGTFASLPDKKYRLLCQVTVPRFVNHKVLTGETLLIKGKTQSRLFAFCPLVIN